MGTVFSFAVTVDGSGESRGRVAAQAAIDEAMSLLRRLESAWSPFLPDTLVQRIRRGERVTVEADDPRGGLGLAEILTRCTEVRDLTRGAFDPWNLPHGFDPTGLVKGWAVERAALVLLDRGFPDVAVGGGGDLVFHGHAPGRDGWSVGLRDPRVETVPEALSRADSGLLVTVTIGGGGACATSGISERGRHVLNPHTGHPASGLVQVSVIGPSLATADALATGLLAEGNAAPDWLADAADYRVLALTDDGRLVGNLLPAEPAADDAR
jgi:thiamine biosynthesis lipoprotein